MNLIESESRLINFLNLYKKEKVALAFSGGVDSSLLLYYLISLKINTMAITFSTSLHPMNELDDCYKICEELGSSIMVVNIDELDDENIISNTKNRCYYCKSKLFNELINEGEKISCTVFMDGTNLDDTFVYRPGIKALGELGIISPLKEAGLTKDEIRGLAKMAGLSYSNKPSMPCMATRIPYDTRLDVNILRRLDELECFVKQLDYRNVRARLHGDIIRLEIDSEDFSKILLDKNDIIKKAKSLKFKYITLDLEGFRSGSMDI